MDEELKELIEATATQTTRQFEELYERLDGVAVDLGARIDGVEARLDAKIDNVTAEARHDRNAILDSVANVNERLTREANDIRSDLHRRFDDTDAFIKYTYDEFERRVSALEEKQE